MKAIRINGQASEINPSGLTTVAELIELIKGVIEPEHMITNILLDGRDLQEADWSSGITKFSTSVLEIETGLPEEYVADRISLSPQIIQACYLSFRDARKCFQDGKMQDGNKKLVQAVAGLKAFFEWYGTLLNLVSEPTRQAFSIESQVTGLMVISKKICQQQMYQSWWAIGETIKNELEPELDKLEDHCRGLAHN
jgi:hypothetical protein